MDIDPLNPVHSHLPSHSPLSPQISPPSELSWTKPRLWCVWGLSPQEKFARIHQSLSTQTEKQDKCFPWWYVEIIVLSTARQTVQLDAGLSPAGKQHSNDPIRRRADWLIWLVTSELPYLWVMPLNAKGASQLTHSNWFREHWEPASFAKGNTNLVEVLDGREVAFIQPTCSTLLASLWDNNCWHLTKTTMWPQGLHLSIKVKSWTWAPTSWEWAVPTRKAIC